MSDHDYSEHRSFERYPTDFEVEANGQLESGASFSDKALMRNISGGGVCLITDHLNYYKLDQVMKVRIRLPDTDRLEAFMCCEATVVWIHSADEKEGAALIGLELNDPLTFESHHRTCNGSSEGSSK